MNLPTPRGASAPARRPSCAPARPSQSLSATRPPRVAADARLWAGWTAVPADRPDPSRYAADGSPLHRNGGVQR